MKATAHAERILHSGHQLLGQRFNGWRTLTFPIQNGLMQQEAEELRGSGIVFSMPPQRLELPSVVRQKVSALMHRIVRPGFHGRGVIKCGYKAGKINAVNATCEEAV